MQIGRTLAIFINKSANCLHKNIELVHRAHKQYIPRRYLFVKRKIAKFSGFRFGGPYQIGLVDNISRFFIDSFAIINAECHRGYGDDYCSFAHDIQFSIVDDYYVIAFLFKNNC